MRFACDGTFRLWDIPLPGLHQSTGLATPDAIALYAPALVGAFEFSTAWIEFFHLNSYMISRAKKSILSLIVSFIVGSVFGTVRFISDKIMRLETRVEGAIFVLWKRVLQRPSMRLRESVLRGAIPEGVPVVLPAEKENTPQQVAKACAAAGAVQWVLRLWRWHKAALSWLQDQVKTLISETKDDFWPWVVAFAGYRLQAGELTLYQVPGYVGGTFAYPVKCIAKFSKGSTVFVLGLVWKGITLPFVASSRAFAAS